MPPRPLSGAPSTASGTSAARAVVLHAAGAVPEPLRASLERRGVGSAWCTSGFGVMAEACRGSAGGVGVIVILAEPGRLRDPAGLVRALRRYAARAVCWQYEAGATPPLRPITHEAVAGWERAALGVPPVAESGDGSARAGDGVAPHSFMAAAASHGPAAERAVDAEDGRGVIGRTAWTSPHPRATPRGAEARPALRLTADDRPASAVEAAQSAGDAAGAGAEPEPAAPVLTADELAVLLGELDEPRDGAARGPGR